MEDVAKPEKGPTCSFGYKQTNKQGFNSSPEIVYACLYARRVPLEKYNTLVSGLELGHN
jgi:hypothetical protein